MTYPKEFNELYIDYGKHKGKFVSELPTDYLKWAAKTFEPRLAAPYHREIHRREDQI